MLTAPAQAASLDSKKAAKVVADSDAARAAYLKRFYGVGDELSTHYDLALNSDSLSIELMSDIVTRGEGRLTSSSSRSYELGRLASHSARVIAYSTSPCSSPGSRTGHSLG